jgi:hypothetical protein
VVSPQSRTPILDSGAEETGAVQIEKGAVMNRRIGIAISSAALVALAVFGSAAGAFAAKSKTTTTRSAAAVANAAPTGVRPEGSGGRGRGLGGPGGSVVDVVAKLTGESTTTVVTARQSGTSFTQIASAKSVTAAQIVELALHAPKAALDSEVSDGIITQSEADKRLADMKAHITAEIAETGVGGPGRGRGHGGPDGPPPADQAPATGSSSGTSK